MGVSEGELKCVSEEDMALSVMRDGVIKMLLLFADNYWDFPLMVCALGSVQWMYLAASYSNFSDSILYISVFSVSCLSFLTFHHNTVHPTSMYSDQTLGIIYI